MAEETNNRAELQRLLKRVDDLLSDKHYHPGLITWRDQYANALLELKDWINHLSWSEDS